VKGRDASDRATFALVGTGTSEKFDGSVLASCSAAPGSTWVKISGEFTVPSNFSCPSAAFLVNDPGSTSQLSYDEFRVEDTTATGAAPLSEKVGVGSSYIPLLMPVGHVYLQGSGGILPLKLFNRDAAEAHTVTFEPITTDWQQLTIAAGQPSTTVTLQPNGSAPVPLTINTSSIGYFELRFNLSSSIDLALCDEHAHGARTVGASQAQPADPGQVRCQVYPSLVGLGHVRAGERHVRIQ
jgi:hypothetical protein